MKRKKRRMGIPNGRGTRLWASRKKGPAKNLTGREFKTEGGSKNHRMTKK